MNGVLLPQRLLLAGSAALLAAALLAGCSGAKQLASRLDGGPPRGRQLSTDPPPAQWPMWGRSAGHGFQQGHASDNFPGTDEKLGVRWQTMLPYVGSAKDNIIPYSPVIDAAGWLYVVTQDCRIHALDPVDGTLAWSSAPLGGELDAAPAYLPGEGDSGLLYLLSHDGLEGWLRVFEVDHTTAPSSAEWEYQLGLDNEELNNFIATTTKHPVFTPDGDFLFAYNRYDFPSVLSRPVTRVQPNFAVEDLYTGAYDAIDPQDEDYNIDSWNGQDIVDIVLNPEAWNDNLKVTYRRFYLITSRADTNKERLLMAMSIDDPTDVLVDTNVPYDVNHEELPRYPTNLMMTRSGWVFEAGNEFSLWRPQLTTETIFRSEFDTFNWFTDARDNLLADAAYVGLYAGGTDDAYRFGGEFQSFNGAWDSDTYGTDVLIDEGEYNNGEMYHGSILNTRDWSDPSDPLRVYCVKDDRFFFDVPSYNGVMQVAESENDPIDPTDFYNPGYIWPPLATNAHGTVTMGITAGSRVQLYAVGQNSLYLDPPEPENGWDNDPENPRDPKGPEDPTGQPPPGLQIGQARVVAIACYPEEEEPETYLVEGRVVDGMTEIGYDPILGILHPPIGAFPLYYTGISGGTFIPPTEFFTSTAFGLEGTFALPLEPGQYMIYDPNCPQSGPTVWCNLTGNYTIVNVSDSGIQLPDMEYSYVAVGGP